jgi:hypothetical protein
VAGARRAGRVFHRAADEALSKEALLFVNKKKQKNFVLRALASLVPTPARTKSFLVHFFKKEPLAYLPSQQRL